MKGMSRILSGALVALLVGSLAPIASADLVVELRDTAAYGSQTVGPVIPITPGETVNLELWAVLTEAATPADGMLSDVWAAATSSNGGLILGDLSITPTDAFAIFFKVGIMTQSPVGGTSAPNAAAGTTWDHDGDGDQDAMGNIPETENEYYRNFFYNALDPSPGKTRDGNEFFMGTVTFVAAPDYGPDYNPAGPSGATEISLIGGVDAANVSHWSENGGGLEEGIAGTRGNALLIIESLASMGPTPDGQMVQPGMDLILDGTAATGSINWWRWEFDGDGVYTGDTDPDLAFEAGEALATLTLEDLLNLGLAEGPHTITAMSVGWVSSPAVNVDTIPGPLNFTMVPEPATLALMGLGLAALARRKRQ